MVSRLFQIVYLLMERDSITARELSEKLEVSVRTVNRDIEKLSEAGIPVYATKGRGGGISLLPDFVLNKKVLSEEEKADILSSMRVMGTVAYEDEQQALNRLEDFFGQAAADWIEIELDSWGQGNFDRERFRILKDAVLNHKALSFDYNGQRENVSRTVRPYKLVFRSEAWYLYAFCELRQEFRYFKFRRIQNLKVLNRRFEPTDVFPKEEPHYVSSEPCFSVKVAIDSCMAYRVLDEIPAECIETEYTDCVDSENSKASEEVNSSDRPEASERIKASGRSEVFERIKSSGRSEVSKEVKASGRSEVSKRIKGSDSRLVFTIQNAQESWVYSYLLSYGPYAEVLEPKEVRDKMADIAAKMSMRYSEAAR